MDKKPLAAAAGNDDTDEEEELKTGGDKLILTCVGVGYSNVSKAIRWSVKHLGGWRGVWL